jgi:hypothetical protein
MLRRYRTYQRGEFIVVGVDTSAGGADYTSAQFLSKTHLDVPVVIHDQKSITAITPFIHDELEKIYTDTGLQPMIAYERQNGGLFELERLGRLNRNGKYTLFTMPTYGSTENSDPNKIGWDTNTATRPKMLQDLQDAINGKVITLYDPPTVKELFTFIINKQGKPEAEENAHDDLVMSLAIAWQLYQLVPLRRLDVRQDLPTYQPTDSVIGI